MSLPIPSTALDMNDLEKLECIESTTGESPQYSVIWLHGLGADGHDFEPIVPQLNLPDDQPTRFVFPHAPRQPVTINNGMVMRAWYDISALDLERGEDIAGIKRSAQLLHGLIKREQERGVASPKIIVAGFSQGGAIALYAGLRHPDPLAGIVALSCYLPQPQTLSTEAHAANRHTPIFMAHGDYDPVVPPVLGDNSRRFLQQAGYPVEWHTYPMPHSVNLDEVSDIGQWLRSRLTD